jgi:hypothetical protein
VGYSVAPNASALNELPSLFSLAILIIASLRIADILQAVINAVLLESA